MEKNSKKFIENNLLQQKTTYENDKSNLARTGSQKEGAANHIGKGQKSERINNDAYWRTLVEERKVVKGLKASYINRQNGDQTDHHLIDKIELTSGLNYHSKVRQKLNPIWKKKLRKKIPRKVRANGVDIKESNAQIEENNFSTIHPSLIKKKKSIKNILKQEIAGKNQRSTSTKLDKVHEKINTEDRHERMPSREKLNYEDASRQDIC